LVFFSSVSCHLGNSAVSLPSLAAPFGALLVAHAPLANPAEKILSAARYFRAALISLAIKDLRLVKYTFPGPAGPDQPPERQEDCPVLAYPLHK